MKRFSFLFILATYTSCVYATSCNAYIENTGARLNGNRIFTTWSVSHDAGQAHAATIYFEYKIHYRTRRNTTLTETGIFRETVQGSVAQFTREKIGVDPVEVLSVDFNRVNCRY